MLGDLPQRDTFPRSGDQKWWAGALQGRGRDPLPLGPEEPAVEGEGLAAPHAADDRNCFLECLLAFRDGGELHPEVSKLVRVPADAEPEDQAAVAETVNVGGEAGGHHGVTVEGAIDDGAEADSRGLGGKDRKVNPALRSIGGVITDEEGIEAELFGEAASLEYPGARGWIVGPREDLETKADTASICFHPGEDRELSLH